MIRGDNSMKFCEKHLINWLKQPSKPQNNRTSLKFHLRKSLWVNTFWHPRYVLRKIFDGFLCVKGLAPGRGRENFGGGFACVLTEIRIRTPYFFGSRNENFDFFGILRVISPRAVEISEKLNLRKSACCRRKNMDLSHKRESFPSGKHAQKL